VLIVFSSFAQDTPVTGKVTSSDAKDGLPGVSIVIKGTTQGVVTDADGNYSINAAPNSTLVFSYIGYSAEEVQVNSRTKIDIAMVPDIQELSQVIVVGYGTQKKSDVTGAIASVSKEDIANVRSANVVESMQGKVAGVDMTRASGRAGSGYNIIVRGTKSLTASNDPLYIVDGIQYSSNVDINPNDIESIDILKDASSTAIYGARGANGVIIITTKKGKKGEARVSFNTYQGVTMPNGKMPVADRDYYINYMNDLAWMRAIKNNWTAIPDKNPEGYKAELEGRELEGLEMGTNYDWYDKLLSNGLQQDYNLTLSGGADKLTYSVSLNHYNEKGMIEQDHYKRYNLRFNLEAPIKKYLKIGTSSLVTYSQQSLRDVQGANNSFGLPLTQAQQLSPLVTPFVDADGKMVEVDEADGKNVKLIYYPHPSQVNTNPLITNDPNYSFNENRLGKVFSTVYADLTFLKDFNFKTSFNAEIGFLRWGRFGGSFPEAGNQSTSEVSNGLNTNYQWQNILTYNKELGHHRFAVTAGQEVLYRRSELYRTAVRDIALENSQWYNLQSQSGVVDPVLSLAPTDEFGRATSSSQTRYPLETRKLLSFLGRFFYSYKGKYSLQLSGRYDGASQLQDKWSFFPSASVAWNISEESFLKDLNLVSMLKLRAGYGVSGNYDVNVYSTLGQIGSPVYYNFGVSDVPANGYRTARANNSDLGWERTSAYNFGLDYGFFGGRIQGAVDIYQTETDDLLQDQTLSPASGIPRVIANVGSTRNKGVEASLTSTNISTEKLTWTTTFTFSRNVEEITSLASGRTQDLANGWFVGQPTNVYYDRKKIGIWQLNEIEEAKLANAEPGDIKFADINPNSSDDRTIIGTPRPKWTGGFNTSLQAYGFDLNVFVYARIGQTIQDGVMTTFQPDGRVNMMKLNYWTPENPSNDVPRLEPKRTNSGYSELSSLSYTDGSFVKVRDITLGYTVPSSIVDNFKVSRARIYVTAKNPFIFSSYFNKPGGRWDPELNGTTGLPMPKMYAVGVNLTF
jgi:TonB-dependent starch-binding outer membrane protein SusC